MNKYHIIQHVGQSEESKQIFTVFCPLLIRNGGLASESVELRYLLPSWRQCHLMVKNMGFGIR